MILLGVLQLSIFCYAFVTGQENVAACNRSLTVLPHKLSKQLLDFSPSESVKLVNISSVQECVESCCKWEKCNYAIQDSEKCFNIQCQSFDECQTEEYAPSSNLSVPYKLIQVRDYQEQCSTYSKSCEVGVDDCHLNEECVPLGRRRKNGCCKCAPNYSRNSNGTCTPVAAETTATPTTPPTTATTRYIRHLAISIAPTSIQLPELISNITAIVVPNPEPNEEYSYKWSVISYPQDQQLGTVEGNNEKTLKLSHLSPGNYTFGITVSSPSSFGEVLANLTVLAPLRVNQRPLAVIQPSSQTIQLPNKVAILNGLSSTDDNKIVSYKWELEKGPISYQFEAKESDTLELKDLVAGNYTVKLTVTDSDGEINSTQATIEVLKEVDYPPEANAGPPIILILPDNEVTLNGNSSTDDHGITAWEWTLVNEDEGGNEPAKAVDMQNTNTPYAHISHLVEGMYRFQLKVYDAAGQSSASKVDVLVRRPSSSEPKVDAGSNVTITLPTNWVLLDGSKSADDDGVIQKWHWAQLQGPTDSVIVDADRPKTNITSLVNGTYTFQLTAWDKSGASGSDNVTIKVLPKENEKPKANAGGDQSVSLPLKWVILNGSSSLDDQGIKSWLWTREPESLAAGVVIANSDRTSTLMLTNLVPGKYVFRLTVTDAQGLSDYDTTTLSVYKNPRELDIVTISLKGDPRTFTESDLTTIREQLALLLHQQGSTEINVNIDDLVIEPKSGYTRTVLQFYTSVKSEGVWKTLPGAEVSYLLKKKLRSDLNLLTYPVLDVDTAICQNNCSGHGVCDQYSRRCICQSLWMENPFKVGNGGDYNCDWSLVYVVIVCGVILSVVVAVACYLVQSCRQKSFSIKRYLPKKRRRSHRYAPLSDPAAIKLTPKAGSTLLPSDIESDDESDVVFESKKNGHANGRSPPESFA